MENIYIEGSCIWTTFWPTAERRARFPAIETYVHADGTVKLPQQTAALFALRLKLLPDESSVQAVIAQLLANFKENI